MPHHKETKAESARTDDIIGWKHMLAKYPNQKWTLVPCGVCTFFVAKEVADTMRNGKMRHWACEEEKLKKEKKGTPDPNQSSFL